MAGLLGLLSDAAELTSKTAKVAPKVAKAGEAMSIPAEIAAQFMKAADPAHIRGAEIMDMLKSGRGSEVTDQMLDMGDPALNARLNEYLYKNADIPMDAASRITRAGEMGFDTGKPLYHGTGSDFQAFDSARFGQSDHGSKGRGVYASQNPDVANGYATLVAEQDRQVYPLTYGLRNPYDGEIPMAMYDEGRSVAFTNNLKNLGFDGVMRPNARKGGEITEAVAFNPTNIRSLFARFDPRLSHLKNLSASVGAGLLGANMMPNNDGSR